MLAGDDREMGKSGESWGPWNETEWQDVKWTQKTMVYKDELTVMKHGMYDGARVSRVIRLIFFWPVRLY